ncbi:peptidoglycan D,D-transpeptidase FtsI family protein [Aliicoccus persicus]|uniref:peptidoglycan D,D-transpeptidase FtsI family protein n=1 Tax=Aliicoccus persicus TaxID=930138 RepID=UPI000B80B71A
MSILKRTKIKNYKINAPQILKSRINFILLIVFLLCLTLVIRLGQLQIVEGDTYQEQIENASYVEVNNSAPRGNIYDRNGELLVGNESVRTVFFTRHRNMLPNDILSIARELSEVIEMPDETVGLRDRQDFVLNNYFENVSNIIPEQYDMFQTGSLSFNDLAQEFYDVSTMDDMDRILDDDDLNLIKIYIKMVNAQELQPTIIKNEGVSEKEFADINENIDPISGVTTGMDWKREYPYDESLRVILGDVSTATEGLPAELAEYYVAQGYSRNDRVGKSYLELMYEEVLSGEKEVIKYSTDRSGTVINQEVFDPGAPGDDIYLTIDIELQQELEDLAEYHLLQLRSIAERTAERNDAQGNIDYTIIPDHVSTVLLAVQDPNNGDILAMVGKQINDDGNIVEFDYANFTTTYAVGSSIKAAVIAAGYINDLYSPGHIVTDRRMVFQDGTSVTSLFNRNSVYDVTDREALMVSSNIYMFQTALLLAGEPYVEGMQVPANVETAGRQLRSVFQSFGLGSSTGLDLPNEAEGISPPFDYNAMEYLNFSIGQLDTYSNMQLLQYISTIAADGQRMKHNIVKEVRKGDPNNESPIIASEGPEVLNILELNDTELGQIQLGLHDVFHGSDQNRNLWGTAYLTHSDLEPEAAGKTGTAEAFYEGEQVLNHTFVGYAPYEEPSMAFSVVIPHMPLVIPYFPTNHISRDVINKYYELYEGQPAQSYFQYDFEEIYQGFVRGTF